MKKHLFMPAAAALLSLPMILSSCNDNDDTFNFASPTALVTVCPNDDGSWVMQLDDVTTLLPTNMPEAPFDGKEVRALVNYTETPLYTRTRDSGDEKTTISVEVNWIDSIRTKLPVMITDFNDTQIFGNDPIEIINDWVTVAEDGYLTLRVRTNWSNPHSIHAINLVTGINPDDPFEMELRHDAKGDLYGQTGDALVAFNLNGLRHTEGDKVRLKIKWRSFTGEKNAEFDLQMRRQATVDPTGILYSRSVR